MGVVAPRSLINQNYTQFKENGLQDLKKEELHVFDIIPSDDPRLKFGKVAVLHRCPPGAPGYYNSDSERVYDKNQWHPLPNNVPLEQLVVKERPRPQRVACTPDRMLYDEFVINKDNRERKEIKEGDEVIQTMHATGIDTFDRFRNDFLPGTKESTLYVYDIPDKQDAILKRYTPKKKTCEEDLYNNIRIPLKNLIFFRRPATLPFEKCPPLTHKIFQYQLKEPKTPLKLEFQQNSWNPRSWRKKNKNHSYDWTVTPECLGFTKRGHPVYRFQRTRDDNIRTRVFEIQTVKTTNSKVEILLKRCDKIVDSVYTTKGTKKTFYCQNNSATQTEMIRLWKKIQSDLPPGWTAHTRESDGRTYYINNPSNTSQWEKPTGPTDREIIKNEIQTVLSGQSESGSRRLIERLLREEARIESSIKQFEKSCREHRYTKLDQEP